MGAEGGGGLARGGETAVFSGNSDFSGRGRGDHGLVGTRDSNIARVEGLGSHVPTAAPVIFRPSSSSVQMQ